MRVKGLLGVHSPIAFDYCLESCLRIATRVTEPPVRPAGEVVCRLWIDAVRDIKAQLSSSLPLFSSNPQLKLQPLVGAISFSFLHIPTPQRIYFFHGYRHLAQYHLLTSLTTMEDLTFLERVYSFFIYIYTLQDGSTHAY